jgi:hypothetical protein
MARVLHHWIPVKRIDQLAMGKAWLFQIGKRGANWGIPQAETGELGSLIAQAEAILIQASSDERSPIVTTECNRIFGALITKMQYIKERYFRSPPLTGEDYTALLLRSRTRSSVPLARPDAIPDLVVSFPGRGQLRVSNRGPLNGRSSADPSVDEKLCIAFGFIGEGNTGMFIKLSQVPINGSELPNRLITKRKHHQLDLDFCQGMQTYLSGCYMNSKNEEGPWSPLINITII